MSNDERACTCTVPDPRVGEPRFDPACPYHGEDGTMVVRIDPEMFKPRLGNRAERRAGGKL